MKGYIVDVSGFCVGKKKLVADAIGFLIGGINVPLLWDGCKRIGNVSAHGIVSKKIYWGEDSPNVKQEPYLISFDNLMARAGWCYVEDSVKGFKDLSKTQDEEVAKTQIEELKKENTELLAEIDKLKAMTKEREKPCLNLKR